MEDEVSLTTRRDNAASVPLVDALIGAAVASKRLLQSRCLGFVSTSSSGCSGKPLNLPVTD